MNEPSGSAAFVRRAQKVVVPRFHKSTVLGISAVRRNKKGALCAFIMNRIVVFSAMGADNTSTSKHGCTFRIENFELRIGLYETTEFRNFVCCDVVG
jgi:hypothetical protein